MSILHDIKRTIFASLLGLWPVFSTAHAAEPVLFDSGKLLATAGVSQIEGAGGGGLAPWALITGYGTCDAIGGNVHGTYVALPDFTLRSPGISIGLFDRLELSYARQTFDTGSTGTKLGLGNGFKFHQNIWGMKARLMGDAVYDQNSWLPQIALGVQYKKNDRGAVIKAIGGKSDEGVDFYLAATKLFLAQSLLVNATLRETKANQFGLLGFGGDKKAGYSTQFEGSIAYLVSRKLALGAEYRTKPDNLSFAREEDVDLYETLQQCLPMLREQCSEASLTLNVETRTAPLMIRGESGKLRQIFLNLLSNAIKFSEEGGCIDVVFERDADGRILTRISDTGIGMSLADIEVAMTPFGQVDSRLARRYEGTGLGLPLTKALVDLHGGTMEIDSTPDIGTTIRLRFAPLNATQGYADGHRQVS